jgi:hypothetical protein
MKFVMVYPGCRAGALTPGYFLKPRPGFLNLRRLAAKSIQTRGKTLMPTWSMPTVNRCGRNARDIWQRLDR